MKRYKMMAGKIHGKGGAPDDCGVIWEEDSKGAWVKYDAVISLLGVEFACNCAEKFKEAYGGGYWLCPAHGYKRL